MEMCTNWSSEGDVCPCVMFDLEPNDDALGVVVNELPDTSEAVALAIALRTNPSSTRGNSLDVEIAATAITADRAALAEAGYEIVKVGGCPSWMSWCASVTSSDGTVVRAGSYMGHEDLPLGSALFRRMPVTTEGDEQQ